MFRWLACPAGKEPIMRRAAVAVLTALLLVVVTAAGPVRAVGAFGPPATIARGCGVVSSRAALGGDGIVRGWVQNDQVPACADEPMIFFQGAGRSWTRTRSPYQGSLLA